MEPFPQIRLAHLPGTPSDNCLLGRRGVPKLPERLWPSLLLSYHFIRNTPEVLLNYAMRSWVLDSGAFSAMNSGADVQLADYIAFCKDILAGPRPPEEVFALDVIGDELATARNTEAMWEAGIEAIPTFHIGSSTQALLDMARD